MWKRTVRLTLLLVVSCLTLSGTTTPSDSTRDGAGSRSGSTEFGEWNERVYEGPPGFLKPPIAGLGRWEGQSSYQWSVTEEAGPNRESVTRTFSLWPSGDVAPASGIVFSYATIDAFVGAVQLGDDEADLLTVWTGGSAYHIVIFGQSGGKPALLWKMGTRSFPEMADVNDDGNLDILVRADEVTLQTGKQTRRQVYQRTGNGYVERGFVHWTEAGVSGAAIEE